MTLLEMSITGAVLITAILLIRTIMINRLPKQTFLILWSLALLRLLVPFTIPSTFSVYSLINRNIPEEIRVDLPSGILPGRASAEDSPAAAISTPDSPATDVLTTQHSAPDILAPDYTAANASTSQHSASAALTPDPSKSSDNDPVQNPIKAESPDQPDSILPKEAAASQKTAAVLFILWGIGAVFCAVYFILSYLRCQLEFSTSLPVREPYVLQWLAEHPARRHITVRQLDRINTPLTYGILHPVILLPRQTDWYNTAWLQYVLAHEYVHICRLDAVTKLLMALALCLHWFNPLVWVMYLFYNRDLELACDEKVIRQYGETSKTAYARMLIDMEVKKSGLMPLCNHFSKNAIEERITAIMKLRKISRPAILLAAGLIIGFTAAFATSATYSSAADHTTVPAAPDTSADMPQADASDMPDNSFTKEEYDALLALQFDGYESMTVSEYQNKAWIFTDTEEYQDLLERFSQSTVLYNLRDENGTASFFFNLYEPLTAERWQSRTFSGGTMTSFPGTSDNAILEYIITLTIKQPDLLTVGEYDAARQGMLDGMNALLQERTREQLQDEAYMEKVILEGIDTLEEKWGNDSLEIHVEYTYMPLSPADTDPSATNSPEYEAARNLLTEATQQISETERQIAALQIEEEEMRAKIIDTIDQIEAQIVLQKQFAEQLSPYFPLGLTCRYDAARARFKMYFQGREVRGIYDEKNGTYISEHAGTGESIYDDEPIELYTVYENGRLTALREATAQEMSVFTRQRQLTSNESGLYYDRYGSSASAESKSSETGESSAKETEPRINEYADEEDYRSLFTLMTPDYAAMSLSEFNQSLLDWANEHYDSSERIREDCFRNDFQVSLSEKERTFACLTMALSAEENYRRVQSLKTGRPQEDPVYHSCRFHKEEDDSLIWCGFDYAFRYHIADPDTVTVGERDRLVGATIDAIQEFWNETNLEDLQKLTRDDVLVKLEEIADRLSSRKITITILEEQLYFEHMDERAYVLDRVY